MESETERYGQRERKVKMDIKSLADMKRGRKKNTGWDEGIKISEEKWERNTEIKNGG